MLNLEITAWAAPAITPLMIVWFLLVCVLWVGYLVLEGFDYGVAMLIPFLGKSEKERRVIINTIGTASPSQSVFREMRFLLSIVFGLDFDGKERARTAHWEIGE